MNMFRVLERIGMDVRYDRRQTCCGQPAFNTGYREESMKLAMRFLDIFHEDGSEYIIAPTGSCVAMVTTFYGMMSDMPTAYQEKLVDVQGRVREFTSFLVDVLHIDDVGAEFDARVTVHDSCHALRELGIKHQPRVLLNKVRGTTLVENDAAEQCCGFGGTFAVKYADISTAMTEEKIDAIIRCGADVVTGVDSSCLMQLHGALRRKTSVVRSMHIADILAAGAS